MEPEWSFSEVSLSLSSLSQVCCFLWRPSGDRADLYWPLEHQSSAVCRAVATRLSEEKPQVVTVA